MLSVGSPFFRSSMEKNVRPHLQLAVFVVVPARDIAEARESFLAFLHTHCLIHGSGLTPAPSFD
jgi:hypothetical protein